MEEMKFCKSCGRELPVNEFYPNRKAKDGLQAVCKECKKAYMVEYNKKKKKEKDNEGTHARLLPCYYNPDLARFSPRELMLELKLRGFRWEYMLEPQRKIMYDKLK